MLPLLGVLALALACARSAPAAGNEGQPIAGGAFVIDGDTLTVAGQRIRLYGIDAPEFHQLCQRDGEPWRCGQAATVALTAGLWWVLDAWTDSTTGLADAATTGLRLAAQFMLNKRWLHNWLVWIIVDAGYVGLYLAKGLVPTALLYLIFIGIAVAGYRSWRATLTRENAMSDR